MWFLGEMGIDDCKNNECESEVAWFKKRATTFDANNFIIEYDIDTGLLKDAKYFFCGAGIPLYMHKSGIAYTVRNTINPNATEDDLNQVSIECKYEAHKATVDTSRANPSRVFMPSNNLNYNIAALSASANDRLDDIIHDTKLSLEKSTLYNECLAAKGGSSRFRGVATTCSI